MARKPPNNIIQSPIILTPPEKPAQRIDGSLFFIIDWLIHASVLHVVLIHQIIALRNKMAPPSSNNENDANTMASMMSWSMKHWRLILQQNANTALYKTRNPNAKINIPVSNMFRSPLRLPSRIDGTSSTAQLVCRGWCTLQRIDCHTSGT